MLLHRRHAAMPTALWAAIAVACCAWLWLIAPAWTATGPGTTQAPAWDVSHHAHHLRLPTQTLVARQAGSVAPVLPRGEPAPLPVLAAAQAGPSWRLSRVAAAPGGFRPDRPAPTAWPRGPPALA